MTGVFLKLVNMSISAGWLVLAVLAVRFALKKAPGWSRMLLWGIVALRLVSPFSVPCPVSLIPSGETIRGEVLSGPTFTVSTGIAPVDEPMNRYLDAHYFEGLSVPFDNGLKVMTILSVVWLVGVFILLGWVLLGDLRLRRRVSTAVMMEKGIFQSEAVTAPFVMGILCPRIYLPFGMEGKACGHVLAHETAHIRRKDHWWKPLGFLLTALHWFNPLVWIAYALLCRDIELACDEAVIRKLDSEGRADYTQTLLAGSVAPYLSAACPPAFGEIGVKERVKAVMNYKKPGGRTVALAVLLSALTAVCFLTDPPTFGGGREDPVRSNPDGSWTTYTPFYGVLGCDGQIVSVWEEQTNDSCAMTMTFYMDTAERSWPMVEIVNYGDISQYYPDLDGDGVGEIVTQICDAEGVQSVCVFLRKEDMIYRGVPDVGRLPGFKEDEAVDLWSEFDLEDRVFRVHYMRRDNGEQAVLESRDLSMFRFEEYRVIPEEIFAGIPACV